MIKLNQKTYGYINSLTDVILMFLSYLMATFIRFSVMPHGKQAISKVWNAKYFTALILMTAVEILVFAFARLYSDKKHWSLWAESVRIIWIGLVSLLSLMAFLYFTRAVDFSRIAILIYYLISTVLLIVKRWILRVIIRDQQKKGLFQRHVILVGNGKHAHQFAEVVAKYPEHGYALDGYVSRSKREGIGPHLGAYENLDEILENNPSIEEVVITLEAHEADFMNEIIQACDKAGVRISIIPFFNDYIPAYPSVETLGGSRVINIREIPLDHVGNAFLKRLFDIVASLLLIVITSPIMLAVAIGVKLSSPGPVLFRQERVGLNKKSFKMLKFRSMRINSEEKTGWSRNSDSRKTKFGSFIRKFSLDEFPQFFNVLRGDMSLVGPRPEIPYFVDQFKDEIPLYLVRQQVRPGITGWAQINGYRGDTSIVERIRHDIWYIEHWSLGLDLKIIFRTICGGMVNSEKLR